MAPPNDEFLENWTAGSSVPLTELTTRFEIPREEITSFLHFIRIYPYGATLIREGGNDKYLYLLRWGKLGVLKKSGAHDEQIATIDAINFVGEMSLFNEGPRTATITVLSDQALVYAFARPSLNQIFSNAKWSELLLTRLSRDLALTNAQLVAELAKIEELKLRIAGLEGENQRRDEIQRQTLLNAQAAFDAILYFQKITRDRAVVGSKGWAHLRVLSDVTRALVWQYLPNLTISDETADIQMVKRSLESMRKHIPASIFDDLIEPME